MTEQQFDDIFRQLADYGETPPPGIWDGIDKGLRRSRRAIVIRWSSIATSIAAAIVICIMLTRTDNTEATYIEQALQGNCIALLAAEEPTISGPAEIAYGRSASGITSAEQDAAYVPEYREEVTLHTESPDEDSHGTSQPEDSRRHEYTDLDRTEGNNWHLAGSQERKTDRKVRLALGGTAQASTMSNLIYSPSRDRFIQANRQYIVNPSLNKPDTVLEKKTKSFSIPVSVGITSKIRLSDKFDIGVGVNYTVMTRKLAGEFNRTYYTDIRNIQQYIGIPVNIYYNLIGNDRLNVYLQAGGTVERGISDSYKMVGADNSIISHKEKIKGVQLSVSAGIGIEYWINEVVGVYFDPTIRYYFDNRQTRSIRTEQPLQTGFETGLRLRL